MSDTTDELAKVKQGLAGVRSALRTVGDRADNRWGFWSTWNGRTNDLAGFVKDITSQVSYLATNVETLCEIIERIESRCQP